MISIQLICPAIFLNIRKSVHFNSNVGSIICPSPITTTATAIALNAQMIIVYASWDVSSRPYFFNNVFVIASRYGFNSVRPKPSFQFVRVF